jgi:hypothetical protein
MAVSFWLTSGRLKFDVSSRAILRTIVNTDYHPRDVFQVLTERPSVPLYNAVAMVYCFIVEKIGIDHD